MTVFGTQTLYAHWTPIHVHAYTQQVQKPEALKTPADCTNNAVYYLSCACGEVSTNDVDTFIAANTALDHDWGAWTQNSDEKTHTRICKRDTSHTETENCHGGTADLHRTRLPARSAAANTARWRHTASRLKKQRRSI